MYYKYTSFMRKLINKDRCIFVNRFSGHFIKISVEVMNILDEIITNEIDSEEAINACEDSEDKTFIRSLLDNLLKLEIIMDKDSLEKLPSVKPLISFAITNYCNLNCNHCSYSAVQSFDAKGELNTGEIIEILDRIMKANPEVITITGGEPLIRTDFSYIAKYLGEKAKGIHKSLMTNATLISDKNIDSICNNFDSIDISIDGIDENTCSKIRGKGVFNRVIKAIEQLHDKGYREISLSMLLAGKNNEYKREFDSLCKKLEVTPVFRKYIIMGRAKEKNDMFNQKRTTNIEDKEQSKESLNMIYNLMKSCSCKAGTREIFIQPNADLYPCPLLLDKEFYIGNILKDNINLKQYFEENLVRNSGSYKALLSIEPDACDKCIECNVNQFCWTCPADLNAYKNDKDLLESWCNHYRKELQEVIWGDN